MRLTVLGAGNGGQALAGDLAMKGSQVVLYEHPDFDEKVGLIQNRGSRIEMEGKILGEGQLAFVTSDIEKAAKHGDILFFVMPSFAQERILDMALPFLRPGQTLVFIPGNFGTLIARKKLRAAGLENRILLAETDTLPYACRQVEPGRISVWGVKEYLWISSLPASGLEATLSSLKPVFPIRMKPMKNVLAVAFANTNMILHCPTMIMNAGRIESDEKGFRFYVDGMTPSVCRVMESMDRERLAVGERLGLSLISEFEDALSNYTSDRQYESLYDVLHNSPVYGGHGADSPNSLAHRYLSEDVPFLLVPVSQFGSATGVRTPLIDSVIMLAETANGVPYRETGRTLDRMGLEGMTAEQVIRSIS
jgi:opine dehydrogenase